MLNWLIIRRGSTTGTSFLSTLLSKSIVVTASNAEIKVVPIPGQSRDTLPLQEAVANGDLAKEGTLKRIVISPTRYLVRLGIPVQLEEEGIQIRPVIAPGKGAKVGRLDLILK